MSVINMTGTGAGGIDPDELTALQKDVVKGKIAGVSGSDEPVEGTLELTGNTDESDVVSGKTFYSDNPYLRKNRFIKFDRKCSDWACVGWRDILYQ